jgi:hypothetical protein
MAVRAVNCEFRRGLALANRTWSPVRQEIVMLVTAGPKTRELGESHAMFRETWRNRETAAAFQAAAGKRDGAEMRGGRLANFACGGPFYAHFFRGNFGELERGGRL